jgi:hypothetical protein
MFKYSAYESKGNILESVYKESLAIAFQRFAVVKRGIQLGHEIFIGVLYFAVRTWMTAKLLDGI